MKKHKILYLALSAFTLQIFASCEKVETVDNTAWVLTWSDEFNEPTPDNRPDPNKWVYDLGHGENGWGNNELQNYTDKVENASYSEHEGRSCLKITAIKTGNGYESARIKTKGKFEQQYGRFEACIKLPYGKGYWPAFWMLGADIDNNPWPGCGEIDIMENKGYQPNIISGALHFPGHSGSNPITHFYGYEDKRFDTDFHLFAIEWNEEKIDFFVDNVLYKRVEAEDVIDGEWVYSHPDKPFFILLNLAVGGNFGGDPNDDTLFPQSMYVDYVRVYKKAN